jgi:hypothetical protein
MTNPTLREIRIQLIGTDNQNVLSDDYVNLMLDDAVTATSASDAMALRYYTCYLIALNWDSIGAVASREGVSFREANPDKYLSLYEKRLLQLSAASSDGDDYAAKVSTNSDAFIDTDTNTIRWARPNDEE